MRTRVWIEFWVGTIVSILPCPNLSFLDHFFSLFPFSFQFSFFSLTGFFSSVQQTHRQAVSKSLLTPSWPDRHSQVKRMRRRDTRLPRTIGSLSKGNHETTGFSLSLSLFLATSSLSRMEHPKNIKNYFSFYYGLLLLLLWCLFFVFPDDGSRLIHPA